METSDESSVLVVLRADTRRTLYMEEEKRLTNLLAVAQDDSNNKELQAINAENQKALNQVSTVFQPLHLSL